MSPLASDSAVCCPHWWYVDGMFLFAPNTCISGICPAWWTQGVGSPVLPGPLPTEAVPHGTSPSPGNCQPFRLWALSMDHVPRPLVSNTRNPKSCLASHSPCYVWNVPWPVSMGLQGHVQRGPGNVGNVRATSIARLWFLPCIPLSRSCPVDLDALTPADSLV